MKEATPEDSPTIIGIKAELSSLDRELFRLAQRARSEGYTVIITGPDELTEFEVCGGGSDIDMRLEKRWDTR